MYIRYPSNSGGIQIFASAVDFPSVALDGSQAVAADTNTIYIYDTTGSHWVPVATPGAAIAIDGLTGDVSATGPGVVPATVNSVGGASAANVATGTNLANAATSANTASAIVRRDSNGDFTARDITGRNFTSTGRYLGPKASAAAPTYAFTGTTASGFYFNDSFGPVISHNGNDVVAFQSNGSIQKILSTNNAATFLDFNFQSLGRLQISGHTRISNVIDATAVLDLFSTEIDVGNVAFQWTNDGGGNLGAAQAHRPDVVNVKSEVAIGKTYNSAAAQGCIDLTAGGSNANIILTAPNTGNYTQIASTASNSMEFYNNSNGGGSPMIKFLNKQLVMNQSTGSDIVWNTDGGGSLGLASNRALNGFFSSFLNLGQISTPSNPAAGSNSLYFKSDNILYQLTSAGVESAVGSGAGVSYPLLAPNGSVGAPSYSFSGATDMGMYRIAANTLAFTTQGVLRLSQNGTTTIINSLQGDVGKFQLGTDANAPYLQLYATDAQLGIFVNGGAGAKFVVLTGGSTERLSIGTTVMQVTNDLALMTAGNGIYIKEGSNATMGTATLSSGTVVVSTTKVTASSRIFITVNGGTLTNVGSTYISARTAGTSFTISSTNVLDSSNVAWIIVEPTT